MPRPEDKTLEERIEALFAEGEGAGFEPPGGDSPFTCSRVVEDIKFKGDADAGADADAAAAWLDAPSLIFGGRPPKEFLEGDSNREFLAGIVSSMEDGAFS